MRRNYRVSKTQYLSNYCKLLHYYACFLHELFNFYILYGGEDISRCYFAVYEHFIYFAMLLIENLLKEYFCITNRELNEYTFHGLTLLQCDECYLRLIPGFEYNVLIANLYLAIHETLLMYLTNTHFILISKVHADCGSLYYLYVYSTN